MKLVLLFPFEKEISRSNFQEATVLKSEFGSRTCSLSSMLSNGSDKTEVVELPHKGSLVQWKDHWPRSES